MVLHRRQTEIADGLRYGGSTKNRWQSELEVGYNDEKSGNSREGVMAKLPVAVGLSLCEQVVIEDKTHNMTLVNCFSHRTLDNFPSETPFTVFALLTGGFGEMPLDVVVQELDDFDEIYRISLPARFASPLRTLRCTGRVRDCSFPQPGHYLVSLLAGGEIVAQRKLQLLLKE